MKKLKWLIDVIFQNRIPPVDKVTVIDALDVLEKLTTWKDTGNARAYIRRIRVVLAENNIRQELLAATQEIVRLEAENKDLRVSLGAVDNAQKALAS